MNPLGSNMGRMSPEEQNAYARLLDLIAKYGAIPEMGEKYTHLTNKYFEKEVQWNDNQGDRDYPFVAHIDGLEYMLRVNDFPEEELYTLFVNNKAIFSFSDLPKTWKYPPSE